MVLITPSKQKFNIELLIVNFPFLKNYFCKQKIPVLSHQVGQVCASAATKKTEVNVSTQMKLLGSIEYFGLL